MHPSRFFLSVALLAVGCAHNTVGHAERYEGWQGRHVSELVDVLGPFETTLIRHGIKSYNWFRFGNCRVTAFTPPDDDKIVSMETEGTPEGCSVYLDRLNAR